MLFRQLRQVADEREIGSVNLEASLRTRWRARLAPFSVMLALGCIYLVWGSTYLSVEFILPAVPPFMIAGVRFTFCGLLLFAFLRLRNPATPITRAHWLRAGASGLCLILGGNAMVVVAQQWSTSSLAALLVATVPFYMAVFGWLTGMRLRPQRVEIALLIMGLLGLALVLEPAQFTGGSASLGGVALVLVAAASWAAGSLIARSSKAHPSPMVFAAMQMLVAGPVLLGLSALTGEPARLKLEAIDTPAILAFAYLTVVGTVAGYCVYVWLVRHADPVAATSYAYVNPVVAMILGALLLHEPISGTMVVGGGLVLVSVALLLRFGNRSLARPPIGESSRAA